MSDVLQDHHVYLSDAVRQRKFEQAVAGVVRPGDLVADVGCGFGILGLMCLKSGASHVWGIDRTEAIEIARETMARSGFADRYTCVSETSFRASLPERVDVVICDHVGYFGFDYGVIAVLDDARRRFLKPGGKIIPERIVLQTAVVESAGCRKLVGAWDGEPIPAEFNWLREHSVNTKHWHHFNPEDMASVPSELGVIDLREDSPGKLSFSNRLEITRDCELDGLAGWFECEIHDGIWMTNSPLSPDQINRAQVFLPFAKPLAVEAGDVVEMDLSVRHEEFIIAWSARVVRTGQTTRQSTWASTILDLRDRTPSSSRIPKLGATGEARRALLSRVDGQATESEIEEAIRDEYPDLFPSADQISSFVRHELGRSTR